jgi:nucleoside-diphosphate-sugar epimerase
MPVYLITGGAGFIGSHIAHELVSRGQTVRILDDFSTGRLDNLSEVRDRVAICEGSICELEQIRPHFAGADYVIHLAALPSVARSVEDPLTTNAVNIGGTLNALVASRDAGVRRLVFAASAAAYGDRSASSHSESDPVNPLSPYAVTKLVGEYYCQVFTRIFHFEAVALRFFNIFGPRQNPESPYTGVLSKFITAYLRGTTPVIFGDGNQSRDFTYVANVVQAVLLAIRAPEAAGKVINVGTGESSTLNQTIELLNGIFGKRVIPTYGPPRPGDVRDSRADIRLGRAILNYEPRIHFEEGLHRTVEWYRTALTRTA